LHCKVCDKETCFTWHEYLRGDKSEGGDLFCDECDTCLEDYDESDDDYDKERDKTL
jgi:hypothetical protein